MKKSLVAALVLASAAGLPARAQADDVPTQIVDAMNKLFGVHPGFRANHAKGVVVEGSFKATADAAKLSKAALFNGDVVPVTVRFSDATGVPEIADGSANANPHGMAIAYHLAGGAETDMVINSLKFFPVATGEEFRDFLLAAAASPPDAAHPTKIEQFMKDHPQAPKALATPQTPASFLSDEYYGVDAFVLVDAAGHRQAVRYIMSPAKAEHLKPAIAAKRPPDYLVTDVAKRLAKGPAVFHLKAQLAQDGDSTKDPSQPWPADRKVVELGVLTLMKPVADSKAEEKKLLFLPTRLVDGIELSDDPLPAVRAAAYAVSFGRRSQ